MKCRQFMSLFGTNFSILQFLTQISLKSFVIRSLLFFLVGWGEASSERGKMSLIKMKNKFLFECISNLTHANVDNIKSSPQIICICFWKNRDCFGE